MTIDPDADDEAPPTGEPTMEALLKEQATFQERLKAREVVWVKVVQVADGQVQVDIGDKHEGVIPISEFPAGEPPAPGARVPAILLHSGRDDRSAALSHKRARWQLGWAQALKAHEEKARVRGRVLSSVRGGFIVDVAGVPGFLPMSLADVRPVRKPEKMIGTGVRCHIIEVNRDKKQVVLSRRAVLEEELKKRRDKLLAELKPGQVVIGRVSHSTPAGVVVNLGGADGFIPTAELAWRDPEKAKAELAQGRKLRVKVLRVELEAAKVTLGIKQFMPNPADQLRKRYPLKTVLAGKVAEVLPAGVRVRLASGDMAFCAAADLPEKPGARQPQARDEFGFGGGRPAVPRGKPHPPDVVWPAAGDEVRGIVTGVRDSSFEVAISIRRFEEIEDRKRIAKYTKGGQRLTLGQILTPEE